MSIKSEKFPAAFEKLFERFDSQDRDKKDVAFLIWREDWEKCCQEFKKTLVAENKELEGLFKFQVKENCRIASQLNEVEDSRDELLKALVDLVYRDVWIVTASIDRPYLDLIKKTEVLKEKINEKTLDN